MRHKEAEAQAAIDEVLREIVGGVLPEDHARVAARGEDRRLVAHREAQNDAGTDGGDGDVLRRGQVRGRNVVARHLEADAVTQVVADARATTKTILDEERAVEPPPRPEAAELDVLRSLRRGGIRYQGHESHQENQPLHRDSSPRLRYGAANRTALKSSLKVPWVWPRN